jgi:hypothetical protein
MLRHTKTLDLRFLTARETSLFWRQKENLQVGTVQYRVHWGVPFNVITTHIIYKISILIP